MAARLWKPMCHLLENSECNVALVILNQPLTELRTWFKTVWRKAVFRSCVDGGANVLYDETVSENGANCTIPDLISGDFDSIRHEVKDYYAKKGVEIVPTPNQDETDFSKNLRLLLDRVKRRNIEVHSIVACVGFAGIEGRVDHAFGLLQSLYLAHTMTDLPVYLMGGHSVSMLLPQGAHILEVNSGYENRYCGLIPIGCRCDSVSTRGLKWNLHNTSLGFGSLISTSNELDGSGYVHVTTDKALFWTMSITFSNSKM